MGSKYQHPSWVRARIPAENKIREITEILNSLKLNTICQSAHCPNVGTCFSHNMVTFMILGDICTRNCRFCATAKGKPLAVDSEEPAHIAAAVDILKLDHVVITSVTRDDLTDGGASQFAKVVRAIRLMRPRATIEVLIPDFGGSFEALGTVVESKPDIVGHNIETVPRLYSKVRPGASFERSVQILRTIKKLASLVTKSGFMLGLGESDEEVLSLIKDIRSTGCDILTIGQYLRPSLSHLPVVDYIYPSRFAEYKKRGKEMGFKIVLSAPLVRSSFNSFEVAKQLLHKTPGHK